MKSKGNLSVFFNGDKKNVPVIFIHGFPFDHKMWDNQILELKNSWYCVSYDIRGLGESAAGDGQFTLEMFVDDLFDIMTEFNIEKPVLCGLSMGGYIALRAVERDQSRFRGLVLLDTKSESDDNEGRLKRAAGIKRINAEGTKGYITDFLPNCFSDISMTELDEVYEAVLLRSLNYAPAGIKGCLLAMAARTDTTDFLDKINIPSLVICGSLDKIVTADQMRKLSQKIPEAEFAVAPKAGHMSPLENPDFVNDVISGFLKRKILQA